MWLNRVAHLNTAEAGIVFSTMSIVAIVLEPIYGVIQDKLGLKSICLHLLFLLTANRTIFEYAFIPLINMNVLLGSVLGGSFISLCLYSGVGSSNHIVKNRAEQITLNTAMQDYLVQLLAVRSHLLVALCL